MVLWRPLLDGLAEGIKSKARTSADGLGCLVQRGSIMALRAIFVRHGGVFSIPQWEAILRETILPAIQAAAENEMSPVVGITSESPHLSSIDFLADSLPIPPPPIDPGLRKFEVLAMSDWFVRLNCLWLILLVLSLILLDLVVQFSQSTLWQSRTSAGGKFHRHASWRRR
jgi:hypothetical protein